MRSFVRLVMMAMLFYRRADVGSGEDGKNECLQQGHQVEVAADGGVALERLEVREFDLVITDLRMPRAQGLDVLRACKSRYPDTPVIVMTAYASAETAMEAIKLIADVGEPLTGRLLLLDARSLKWRELRLPRDPHCPACGGSRADA